MHKTRVPFGSALERLVGAVKEGSKELSKSLNGFKLRRTSQKPVSNYTLKKTDCVCP